MSLTNRATHLCKDVRGWPNQHY